MSEYDEWVPTSRGSKRGRARRGGRSRPRGSHRGHHSNYPTEEHTQTNFYKPKYEEKLEEHKEVEKHGFRPNTAKPSKRHEPIIEKPANEKASDISVWGDEIPDFLIAKKDPVIESKPVKTGKKSKAKSITKTNPRHEAKDTESKGIEFIVKDDTGYHYDSLKSDTKDLQEMDLKQDIREESHVIPTQENVVVQTYSSQPSEPSKDEEAKISTDQRNENPEQNEESDQPKKEETEEERRKREEEEKRARDIEMLERQIQDQEALMFDWGNLEETIEKQNYIEMLKQQLDFLKNPNKKKVKKGKKGKKTATKKDDLMVSIFKPQLSKNSIVKEQLMTEKSVRL